MGILLAVLIIAMYTAGLLITPAAQGDLAAELSKGTK